MDRRKKTAGRVVEDCSVWVICVCVCVCVCVRVCVFTSRQRVMALDLLIQRQRQKSPAVVHWNNIKTERSRQQLEGLLCS